MPRISKGIKRQGFESDSPKQHKSRILPNHDRVLMKKLLSNKPGHKLQLRKAKKKDDNGTKSSDKYHIFKKATTKSQ